MAKSAAKQIGKSRQGSTPAFEVKGNKRRMKFTRGKMTGSSESRVRNSMRNAATSVGGQLLNNLLRFLCRTVFIYTLGKEFVNKLTGGKYEYVIATHVDQGHIHNHIIFNATSFIDHKKYHHEKKDKYRMWRINDKICKENNLSVIEKYSGKKGHGKYEHEKRKSKESWKQQLENMIDKTIQEAISIRIRS